MHQNPAGGIVFLRTTMICHLPLCLVEELPSFWPHSEGSEMALVDLSTDLPLTCKKLQIREDCKSYLTVWTISKPS